MDGISPYQAPSAGPPPVPSPAGMEPPAIKVFGIMHLVLAGFGVLTGVGGLIIQFAGNPFLSPRSPGYEAQMRFQEEMVWISVMSGAFSLALAGLLLVSGIKLIRSRPDGVRWSHRYAWTSIATKLVTVVVTVIFVLPTTSRMIDQMIEVTPGKSGRSMTTVVHLSSTVGAIAGPIVMCLYPALALYFLSRRQVTEWCDRNRTSGA